VKRFARRRVAHLIFFNDLILRRHQRTGGSLPVWIMPMTSRLI
jgi:hypothetical protein